MTRSQKKHPRRLKRLRRGEATFEAVMVTGAMFPLAVALYYLGIRGFTALFRTIHALVTWPYL